MDVREMDKIGELEDLGIRVFTHLHSTKTSPMGLYFLGWFAAATGLNTPSPFVSLAAARR
jgi:hypothetical protein